MWKYRNWTMWCHLNLRDKTIWLCFYFKAGPKQCMNHFLWKRVNCRPSAHHLTPGQVHWDPLPQDVCFSAAGFFWNRDQLPLISSQSRCGGDAGERGLRLFFLKSKNPSCKDWLRFSPLCFEEILDYVFKPLIRNLALFMKTT